MARPLKLGAQSLAVAAVAALLGLLVWKLLNQPSVPKGSAPNFTLPRLDGDGRLQLAALRGKPVVLNFWASWCEPCKEETPLLQKASERWRARGVVFVGIDAQDFKGDARRFARRYGVTYPIVHDGPGTTVAQYGVTGFPETFFIDRRGRIVRVVDGEGRTRSHFAGPVSNGDLERNIRRILST